MTTTRKVNAHTNAGTLQQGDVVLGERVSGTTVLFTVPDLAAGGAVDSVNGQTGVVVLDADDIDDTSTTQKFVTSGDLTTLSTISGVTASGAELNILDGATLSTAELNYVDGVTSAIQTQLDGKAASLGADDNYVTDAEKVKLSNLSGTNTGDQTSIVGITGTKAQFDTAVSDGNILYVGDITQYTDELAQDAVGGMVDASLTYVDGTPLLQRSALTGDVTASAGSNATTIATPAVATVATDDKVLIKDTSASDVMKYVTAQSIRDIVPGSGTLTSAQLATSLTDETGTGAAVFATSPTLVTPVLGTPASGTLTNCTGLPASGSLFRGFRVSRSTAQTISTATNTKMQLNTEEYDTGGEYDPTTNYRHTPTVAGKWMYLACGSITGLSDGKSINVKIYKNGAAVQENKYMVSAATAIWGQATTVLDMNGTTDYVELYINHDHGSDRDTDAFASVNWLSGYFIGV